MKGGRLSALPGSTWLTACLPLVFNHQDFFANKGLHGMLANDKAAEQQLAVAHSQVLWLDQCMQDAGSPTFVCGDKFTVCDCMLYVMIEFWDGANQGIIKGDWFGECGWIPGWFERVAARPSASAFAASKALKPTAAKGARL